MTQDLQQQRAIQIFNIKHLSLDLAVDLILAMEEQEQLKEWQMAMVRC